MQRCGFTITLTCGVLLACCAAQAQLDQILNKLETTSPSSSLPGMALSNDKIAGGLKEALTKSTGSAVASTGHVDGYFKNQAIKILLPNQLQTVGKGMRMMGMGAQLDELELAMNRAAEQAAPAAKQIFINAITKMSFDDARKILSGGNTMGVIAPEMIAGVLISDNWWVNARQRSLTACRFTEVELGAKKLPEPTGPLATVLAACGKARKTIQAPLPGTLGPGPLPGVRLPTGAAVPSAKPEVLVAVKAVSVKYRDSMAEIIARAGLPHDLPGNAEMSELAKGVNSGPKKPALERVFKPMGYSVSGGTGCAMGSFHLRRRTAANSTLELDLETGTWFPAVMAMFFVYGLGFKATLILPPTQKTVAGCQYSIGDAEQWQKIVENLGALLAELERTFVPEIEAVAGPSPEWYQPES